MTDANKDSCNFEGEKDDRRIDDLLAVCVVEEAAGFAVEEMLEATPFGVFDFPMVIEDERSSYLSPEKITERSSVRA